MQISEDAIRRMRSNADAIIQLPNERLKREAEDTSFAAFSAEPSIHEMRRSRYGICVHLTGNVV